MKCGSMMRNKRGMDKAQTSRTARKKTKQLTGIKSSSRTHTDTHTHTLMPSRSGNNDSARRVRSVSGSDWLTSSHDESGKPSKEKGQQAKASHLSHERAKEKESTKAILRKRNQP
eukprot:5417322-Amphidinium_carterae.3